ncbi:MAG: DUF1579 family protein [Gaiellaceae bacterium]
MEALDVFAGEWSLSTSLAAELPQPPRARCTFEWLPGRRFLVQRWEVELPEAPDGIAIIGYDEERATYLQHYFDSRGIARVYEMTLDGKVWKLSRRGDDFSQRFTGTFSEDGDTIEGTWEISEDGSRWEHDFDLTYTRVG